MYGLRPMPPLGGLPANRFWHEGVEACLLGARLSDCPHVEPCRKRPWRVGFLAAVTAQGRYVAAMSTREMSPAELWLWPVRRKEGAAHG